MHWIYIPRNRKLSVGKTRTREFFAWFPVSCGTIAGREWRWLERVRVEEKCRSYYYDFSTRYWWDVQKFIDEETQ
jgi:hypothetical protein